MDLVWFSRGKVMDLDVLRLAIGNGYIDSPGKSLQAIRDALDNISFELSSISKEYLNFYPELSRWKTLDAALEEAKSCEWWDCDAFIDCLEQLDDGVNPNYGNQIPKKAIAVTIFVGNDPVTNIYANSNDAIASALSLGFRIGASLDDEDVDDDWLEQWRNRLIVGAWVMESNLGLKSRMSIINTVFPSNCFVAISLEMAGDRLSN
jgi:hypothetical protein